MLLKKRNLHYQDVVVSRDATLREEMERLSGRRSVPQILIGDVSVGGFDELYELDRSGGLDRVLREQAPDTGE